MVPLIRNWLRKLGRVSVVSILTVLSTVLAYLLNYCFVELLDFTYIPFEDLILISSITFLVTPLLSWYLIGLFLKMDAMEVQMTQLATTDSLTSTYNRGYFYKKVESILSGTAKDTKGLRGIRQSEAGHLPGLFILDLDNLKSINDQYGHAAGDKVLSAFSAILLELVSKPNIVGRLGGDEFVVFFNRITQSNAQIFAEKVLEQIRSKSVEFDGSLIPFAVSIGFSNIHGSGEHAIDMAMKDADNALYKVKRTGRNSFEMMGAER